MKLPLDFDPGGDLRPEPPPTFDVFAALAADLRARDALGWKQHGVALDARFKSELEWLEEAYAEALDKLVYLKAAILRRKNVAL